MYKFILFIKVYLQNNLFLFKLISVIFILSFHPNDNEDMPMILTVVTENGVLFDMPSSIYNTYVSWYQ